MITSTVTEAKARLSALLRRVRRGETVLILHRGRPVARIEPARPQDEREDSRLARLERAGVLRAPSRPTDWAFLMKPTKTRLSASDSLLRALLQDRAEER